MGLHTDLTCLGPDVGVQRGNFGKGAVVRVYVCKSVSDLHTSTNVWRVEKLGK